MSEKDVLVPGIGEYVREMISSIGEDPDRDGLVGTPERVERSFRTMTAGYRQSPEEVLNGAVFESDYDEMVLVKEIDFFSLCDGQWWTSFIFSHLRRTPDRAPA